MSLPKRIKKSSFKTLGPSDSSAIQNYVVVGGGISGISCAQELYRILQLERDQRKRVVLIVEGRSVKCSKSIAKKSETLEEITAIEQNLQTFASNYPGIKIIQDKMVNYSPETSVVLLESGVRVKFEKICVCTGATPKSILRRSRCDSIKDNSNRALSAHMHALRDVDSIHELSEKLDKLGESRRCFLNDVKTCQLNERVVITGNGGIALELVHELTSNKVEHVDQKYGRFPSLQFELQWLIKDEYIGNAYFDASASAFVMPSLIDRINHNTKQSDSDVYILSSSAPAAWNSSSCTTAKLIDTPDIHSSGNEAREHAKAHPNPNQSNILMHSHVAAGPGWLQRSDYFQHKHLHGSKPENKEMLQVQYEVVITHVLVEHRLNSENTTEPLNTPKTDQARYIEYMLDNYCWECSMNGNSIPCNNHEIDRSCTNDNVYTPLTVIECEAIYEEYVLLNLKTNGSVLLAYPLYVKLSNGKIMGTDLLIVAIGVVPNESDYNDGQFIDVNTKLQHLSYPNVYAAGDCCHVCVEKEHNLDSDIVVGNWFQMRLWSQARSMGIYASHCMLGVENNYCVGHNLFDLFIHITHFFDYKVVLLGRYNGQGLEMDNASVKDTDNTRDSDGIGSHLEYITKTVVVTQDGISDSNLWKCTQENSNPSSKLDSHSEPSAALYEIWTRVTANVEYIKLIIYKPKGTIVGAMLIGDTGDLEETIEHLMKNHINVNDINILDPNIDIEDYFD